MLGVGVQRQALKEAGINHEVVAISEVDKYALKAYELLHGETLNLGDIRNIERIMGRKDVDIDKVMDCKELSKTQLFKMA